MPITRFAPSPTGLLHLGHAYSAWLAYETARKTNSRFIVRIENIDPGRCKPEYETAILEDLAWLGLAWDTPVRRQSEHMDDYKNAIDSLTERNLIYPCFCSRKDIADEIARSGVAPHGPDGPPYPGICRKISDSERKERIAEGTPHALRLNMKRAMEYAGPLAWHDDKGKKVPAHPQIFGDVTLARKETPTSYHLAVAVDDHIQNVGLVVRGEDLFHSTHIHRLLQALLGFNVPQYFHHNLLKDESGRRYSKRDKSVTLRELREKGTTPGEIRRKIGIL